MSNQKENFDETLDFESLRKEYMNEAVKVPLVKSEFIHYCQNPMTNIFGEGTIITMEIVQAPKSLQYKRLEERKSKVALENSTTAASKRKMFAISEVRETLFLETEPSLYDR